MPLGHKSSERQWAQSSGHRKMFTWIGGEECHPTIRDCWPHQYQDGGTLEYGLHKFLGAKGRPAAHCPESSPAWAGRRQPPRGGAWIDPSPEGEPSDGAQPHGGASRVTPGRFRGMAAAASAVDAHEEPVPPSCGGSFPTAAL